VVIGIFGNPRIKDEGLLAYEAGYRTTILGRVSLDLAAFYNHYDHQLTAEPGAPFFEPTPPPVHIVIPQVNENLMLGETHGIEIAAKWKVSSRWTLSPGYSFEEIHMHTEAASQDTQSAAQAEGSSPRHSAQLRSHVAWSSSVAWDASAYFVDRLRDQKIPSYTRLDTQVTWRYAEGLSLRAVGQNLLKGQHFEFFDSDGSVNSSSIKSSAYVELRWQF
jgi:iron complex outermembrane receptor protein